MQNKGEHLVDGDKPNNVLKVLIVRCHKSKALFAHVVPQTGIDEKHCVVYCLTKDILWLGYPRVLLKCDTEKRIMAMLRESLKSLKVEGMEASPELPPPYDSQSNGGTEVGVKLVKHKLATHRSCLEERIGRRILPTHPLMSWLVSHTAMVLTYCIVGSDGMSAYHLLRGRPFGGRWVSFGEIVQYRRDNSDAIRGFKLVNGIFVGMQLGGAQYALYDTETRGIVYTRSVSRLPDSQKFDPVALESVDRVPYELHVAKPRDVPFREAVPQDVLVEDRIAYARDVYLREADFEAYGYSDSHGIACAKCTFHRTYGWRRAYTKPHSKACKERIIERLRETPAGRERLDRAATRLRNSAEDIHARQGQPPTQGEMAAPASVPAPVADDNARDAVPNADAVPVRFENLRD